MLITIEFLEEWDFTKKLPVTVRTYEIISEYKKFKNHLTKNNINIEDYIMNKFLKNKKYSIEQNNFPYNITDNMAHYVLWIEPNYFKEINDKQLLEIILIKMNELGYNEYFCFENHIGCKSVLGIPHYQVFFRKC
jgi:hypothetical protein